MYIYPYDDKTRWEKGRESVTTAEKEVAFSPSPNWRFSEQGLVELTRQ